jgi:ribokinase
MNESETAILSDMPADAITASSDLGSITEKFFDKGVSNVIITLGAEGAYYQSAKAAGEGQAGRKMPATKAAVVDTTAAGDTFVGAFAVKLAAHVNQGNINSEAVSIDAISFAIRAAGKTVQKPGAQSSIPWLDELE